ncbi:MAG: hypothetical protein FD128_1283 [Hyphomonadaceae bacterium]|nr:MAG: hypothetical protein FD128_1283 [Hyphomonadaceae bacterium]
MRQVIIRSLKRAIDGKDVFLGCREDWRRLLNKDHPIRIAWDTFDKRRAKFEEMLGESEYSHLKLFRCFDKAQVLDALAKLSDLYSNQSLT